MKKRIQIDSSLLSFIIILTGFLYLFPGLYGTSRLVDNIFDFIGMMSVLKGVVWRMAARGHKKANSRKGAALVTDGLYALTRNPMYLGSFFIGAGFVFIVWPFWTLPIFAGLFYTRFNKQMVKEESVLSKHFGKEYRDYCQKVPRIFPSVSQMIRFKISTVINMRELFSTKETRGLVGWPILAVVLETVQEIFLFQSTDILQTIVLFISAMVVFGILFAVAYYQR